MTNPWDQFKGARADFQTLDVKREAVRKIVKSYAAVGEPFRVGVIAKRAKTKTEVVREVLEEENLQHLVER